VRLVTWNVAGRVTRQPEQAAALAAIEPDVVALQEVTARTLPLWRTELERAGLTSVKTALEGAAARPGGRRRLGALTAARRQLRALPAPGVPWPERLLCCALGDIEIVNLHSPISPAPGLAKVLTHEAVAAYLEATAPEARRVLCGDLNTPRRELPDGTVLTFAHDSAGRLRPERGERWHRAESALVHGSRAGSTRSASCTATASARRAGAFRRTAAAGASTMCSSTGCGRSRAPMRTTGGEAA
jgi:exonuclease III